jgi:Ca2+-binding RTX toxin-like protein
MGTSTSSKVSIGSAGPRNVLSGVTASSTADPQSQAAPVITKAMVLSLSAQFSSSSGSLTVFGDSANNLIAIGRDAAGKLLVNAGAVPVIGGTPTVANTSLIQVFGLGGNDVITLNESNGPLPRANFFGGAGNDALQGGSGSDMLFGQSGDDRLSGKGGNDFLFGGDGNDVLAGGDGDDQMFGQAGDDRLIWNPGDDTDLFEGGSGVDTAEVNGGNGAEAFTVTANGTRVRFDRINPAPFALDIGTTENLVLRMNGGDDTFSATGNLAALTRITVDGGAGNDTIRGSNGADVLLGGAGNDFIDGQQGNDVALLGAGDDIFQWDPGDGSDTVEGQAGSDTMLFNGSGAPEIFDVSANGERVRFTRNVGNIVMDLNGVERIDLNTLGGTDTLIVNDMSGTGLTEVNVDLAGVLGGSTGDAQADTVIAHATNGNDIIDVFGSGTNVSVGGLPALINVRNSEGANDSLVINALGGNDSIRATTLPAGIVKLTIDAGAGNDNMLGSQGADVLLGGEGNDFIFGDNGNDVALMGAGDDVFQWDPGDGSDTVEGQDGTDTMLFFGSGNSENIDVVANGGRVLFFRDVGAVTMDLDDVERIELRALGGADNIVVGDLAGTDLTRLDIDLWGLAGGGDGQTDNVTVNATQGDDVFGVAGDAGGITVFGLQAAVNLFRHDGADRLTLNGLGGADVIDATRLEADGILLTMNGGLGADVLLGGEGGDLFNGGDGNDFAFMGAGNDTFVWNPGDDNDTLEGQAGTDTMLFNGANAGENIDIAANGGRAVFFRNIANVTMDLNDTEVIEFNALGGADTISVHDLTGTDVEEVRIDLAAALGGTAGDAQPDRVIVDATNGDDVVLLSMEGGVLVIEGLQARIVIEHFDANLDVVQINGLAGDDLIDASTLPSGVLGLIVDSGAGDDVVLGGAGHDAVFAGAGDDVVLGGAGDDLLDGGPGDDVLLGEVGNDVLINGEIAIQSLSFGATGLFA